MHECQPTLLPTLCPASSPEGVYNVPLAQPIAGAEQLSVSHGAAKIASRGRLRLRDDPDNGLA
jgi:hypothetical protein